MSAPRRDLDVAAVVHAAIGETPDFVRPVVGGGVVNSVFEVATSRGPLIVRMQPNDPDCGTFHKERWCMERMRELGTPGAEVVAIGVHGRDAYAIHTRLPGVVGTQFRGDTERVWREIGRQSRGFHQIRTQGFGEHLGGVVQGAPGPALADVVEWWIAYIFERERLVDAGLLTKPAAEQARETLLSISDWDATPRLCHGNLTLANVLVDGDDVYVIDWGTAAGHVAPELDLAELLVWSIEPDPPSLAPFLRGYGLEQTAFEAMRRRIDLLQLWRALSSAAWLLREGNAPQLLRHHERKIPELLKSTGSSA